MLLKNIYNRNRVSNGFSLIELMLSTTILIIILVGLLYTYVACFELNEFSKNLTLINNGLQAELEYVRETPFDSLTALDGQTFSLNGFPNGSAIGAIEVYNSIYDDLKYVRLVACWRQKSQRIIGEDKNLDGILQNSEDIDGDTILDSPAELSTLISKIN